MTAKVDDNLFSLLSGTCVAERTCVAGQAFYQTWAVGTGTPSPNYRPETQAVPVQQCLDPWHPTPHLQLSSGQHCLHCSIKQHVTVCYCCAEHSYTVLSLLY